MSFKFTNYYLKLLNDKSYYSSSLISEYLYAHLNENIVIFIQQNFISFKYNEIFFKLLVEIVMKKNTLRCNILNGCYILNG